MQTEEEELRGIPANNFSVARVQHELPNRSAVGAIFVNRQATGDLAGDRDYNRSYAFDARVGFGQNGLVNGFVARTQTPGLSGEQYAFNIGASRNTEKWRLGAGYAEVGDDFNPEVGFLARENGFRKTEVVGEPEHPACSPAPSGNSMSCGRMSATTRTGTSTVCSSRVECTSTSTGSSARATSFTPA